MKNTVRLNFEFPRKHYPYLRMLCAEKGQSLKDFASDLLIREIEEYEDRQLALKAEMRLGELKDSDLIDFNDATRLAGWDNAE